MNLLKISKKFTLYIFFIFAALSLQGAELLENGSAELIQLARDGKYEELKESIITSFYYLLHEEDLYCRIAAALTEFDASSDQQSDLWSQFINEVDQLIMTGKDRDLKTVDKFFVLASKFKCEKNVTNLPRVYFIPETHNSCDSQINKYCFLSFLLSRMESNKVQILIEGIKYGETPKIGLFSFIILDFLESAKASSRNQEYEPRIHQRNRRLLAQHLIDDQCQFPLKAPHDGLSCLTQNFHHESIIKVSETGWDLPGLGHSREGLFKRNQSMADAIEKSYQTADYLIIPCGMVHSPKCDFDAANDLRKLRQEKLFENFDEFYENYGDNMNEISDSHVGTTKPIYDMLIKLGLSFK